MGSYGRGRCLPLVKSFLKLAFLGSLANGMTFLHSSFFFSLVVGMLGSKSLVAIKYYLGTYTFLILGFCEHPSSFSKFTATLKSTITTVNTTVIGGKRILIYDNTLFLRGTSRFSYWFSPISQF